MSDVVSGVPVTGPGSNDVGLQVAFTEPGGMTANPSSRRASASALCLFEAGVGLPLGRTPGVVG
jgi:hypothetical protein